MIELKDDHLVFRFPEVHEDAVLEVGFQRTLRIPDDNREYDLPPGLGTFPINHVDDHVDRLPAEWRQARRGLPPDAPGRGDVDRPDGGLPDGREGGGGEGERGDRRSVEGWAGPNGRRTTS